MAKKPATKPTKAPTRITQDAPKASPKASTPPEAEKPPKDEPATTSAGSTDPGPVAANEPAFPDVHSIVDHEHGILHRLRATAIAEGSATARRKVIKAIDTDQSHPVVQRYKEALLEWLAA